MRFNAGHRIAYEFRLKRHCLIPHSPGIILAKTLGLLHLLMQYRHDTDVAIR